MTEKTKETQKTTKVGGFQTIARVLNSLEFFLPFASLCFISIGLYRLNTFSDKLDKAKQELALSKVNVRANGLAIDNFQTKQELDRTKKELNDLTIAFSKAPNGTAANAIMTVQLKALQDEVDQIKTRDEVLNNLLGDDPEKRMSLIILSRDFKELKDDTSKATASIEQRSKDTIDGLREESKSQMSLIFWAIGFVGITNLANLLSPYLKGIFAKKEDSADKEVSATE